MRKLPGLGAYTAAAVAAIAFGEDAAPVDTNVERVLARLHAVGEPSRAEIECLFLEMAPSGRAGDIAQALMDLGSAICRPRAPRCGECPLAHDCRALASGTPENFPAPKLRRERPKRFGVAQWIERDGSIWLVRRPKSGLLGGMAALPGCEWTEEPQTVTAPLAVVRHVFTHFSLELAVVAGDGLLNHGWWQPLDTLGEAGLPTLYRKAAEQVLAARTRAPDAA